MGNPKTLSVPAPTASSGPQGSHAPARVWQLQATLLSISPVPARGRGIGASRTWQSGGREPGRAHAQKAPSGPQLTWESRNSTTTFSLLHRAAISHTRRPDSQDRVFPAPKPTIQVSVSHTQPTNEPSHAPFPLPLDHKPLADPITGSAPSSRLLQSSLTLTETLTLLASANTRPLPQAVPGVVVHGRVARGKHRES